MSETIKLSETMSETTFARPAHILEKVTVVVPGVGQVVGALVENPLGFWAVGGDRVGDRGAQVAKDI